ncbi:uncharacterized protein LOC130367761 [Hyla sarda]|uniref:uncharacterized protein LOC130367761 n=1 Tax=Hyla sarda TaxID=327740 RepID=UPI0024C24F67|nr:uncharacterized protein LOC130367761 [Hyla sarda]
MRISTSRFSSSSTFSTFCRSAGSLSICGSALWPGYSPQGFYQGPGGCHGHSQVQGGVCPSLPGRPAHQGFVPNPERGESPHHPADLNQLQVADQRGEIQLFSLPFSGLSGPPVRYRERPSFPSSGQAECSAVRRSSLETPASSVHSCLHGSTGQNGGGHDGGSVCSVPLPSASVGHSGSLGRVPPVLGSPDPSAHLDLPVSSLVAPLSPPSERSLVSTIELASSYNGCEPPRLGGGGGVLLDRTVQGRCSPQEARLPINVLEIRAMFLCLQHWESLLQGRPVRIQSDNATAAAYVNRQGGTRSSAAMTEVSKILTWAERMVPLHISDPHPGGGQLGSGLSKSLLSRSRGVVPSSGGVRVHLPSLGDSRRGPLCIPPKSAGPNLCGKVQRSSGSCRGRSRHSTVSVRSPVPVSATSPSFPECSGNSRRKAYRPS